MGALANGKVAVLFPGTGYTCERPLLQRLAERYEQLGYEVIRLHYGGIDFRPIATVADAVDAVKPIVRAQAAERVAGAADVVLIGKSLGTAAAAWFGAETKANARYVLLTPIPETRPLFDAPERIVLAAIGTRDPFWNGEALAALCREKGVRCFLVEGGDHSLAFEGMRDVHEALLEELAENCI